MLHEYHPVMAQFKRGPWALMTALERDEVRKRKSSYGAGWRWTEWTEGEMRERNDINRAELEWALGRAHTFAYHKIGH